MGDKNNNGNGGIGFCGMLTILFIGLKLANIITWSWWVVLSPLLASVLIFLILFAVMFSYHAIQEKIGEKNRDR